MIRLPPPLAFALLAAAFVGLPAWAASDPVLVPRKVSAHGWFFQGQAGMASAQNEGFMSNAGFVVTPAGVIAFDALGTPALGRAMLKAIAKVTPQPVVRVIVSHSHADHVYGLQEFRCGFRVWVPAN